MSDLQKRIDHLEETAAQSEMLSERSTDEEVRSYNRRLAVKLREYAQRLRQQMQGLTVPKDERNA
jgi:protein subunit release factor A